MSEKTLKEKFVSALTVNPPNYEKARELMDMGVDINEKGYLSDNLFCDVLLEYMVHCFDCDNYGVCRSCGSQILPHLPQIAHFFIEQGFDVMKHGIRCIEWLSLIKKERDVFCTIKVFLQNGLPDDSGRYKDALYSLSVQNKRYSRTSLHDIENITYAMYKAVLQKSQGVEVCDIDTYHEAIGLTLDGLVYFHAEDDIRREGCNKYGIGNRGFVFSGDIGFVCGDKLLVVTKDLKLLMMNDRLRYMIKTDISYWLDREDVFCHKAVGAKIEDIAFEDNEIEWKNGSITKQPVIKISFDNNVEMRFTNDRDENPQEGTCPRFLIIRKIGGDAMIRVLDSANLYSLFRQKSLSDYTVGCVNEILSNDREDASANRYLTELYLTDMLIKSPDEETFLHKLTDNYPEVFV